jgi:ABC-type lipopolysaccharide export system ATPase subunit
MPYIQSICYESSNGITDGQIGPNGVMKNQICAGRVENMMNNRVDMHRKASIGNFYFIQRATVFADISVSNKSKYHLIV